MSNLSWLFAQVDFRTVLAMGYSLLPFMHSQICFVCIIAVQYNCCIRDRSQLLSTFIKAYREYARGRGSGTTVRFYPENQHLFLIADKTSQCDNDNVEPIIKYGTRLESGRTSFSLLYRLLFTTTQHIA